MSTGVPIVLDNGTSSLKAGFATESLPRIHLPNLIGRPKYTVLLSENFSRPHLYFGQSAQGKRGGLLLSSSMRNGVVVDWDNMLHLWDHLFNCQLQIETKNHALLITETINGPRLFRQSLISLLFEVFNFPAVFVASQSTLAMYGAARTTGLIVNCGEGSTCVTPIVESFCINNASYRHSISGAAITNYLQRLLTGVGCRLETTSELQIAREIKEKLCYVATDIKSEIKSYKSRLYQLPDGNQISLGIEQYIAPEILFTHGMYGYEQQGLSHLIAQSIFHSPTDVRKSLASNIVITGGTTMFTGFKRRLENDLKALIPSNIPIEIVATDDRINTVWLGGSVLASLQSFDKMWITQQEYMEWGESIIREKFL